MPTCIQHLRARTFSLVFLVCCLFVQPFSLRAGDADSIAVLAKRRANKSALFSAILPGSGQVLNKKYWKVPFLYAGFGTLAYFIKVNGNYYKDFRTAYLYRNDNDPATVDAYPKYSNDDLQVRKDYYRRNRDLCYILTGVLYTLNIIDAYVDAQLMDFDVSDNLSLRTSPCLQQLDNGEQLASLRFTLMFK